MSEPMTNNKFNPWPMTEPAYKEQDLRIAKEWVYKVHAWRGRSPEFMVGQSERLATEFSRLRSEARAEMREACANAIGNFKFLCEQNERAYSSAKRLFSQAVRDVPDLAADEAIERIKREARLEEAKWWHPHDSYHHPGCVGCKRIAALSGKESLQ